jgi:OPA family glycerol-3-phosphate transporter-like MFS transporter
LNAIDHESSPRAPRGSSAASSRLFRWQGITLATLFTGYAGYYICRSNLSVATPLILTEYGASGITKADIGWVASVGVLLYAIGKVTNGVMSDYVGGRQMFLFGMWASVACSVVFGLMAGLTAFVVIWAANRYVQSMGWVALVKTASRWYPFHRQASVMGVLSMSYLLGDVFARGYLGTFIEFGAGWRDIFFIAAATFGAIALIATFTLKSSPCDIGEPEPESNPANVFGSGGDSVRPANLAALLGPLLKSQTFWVMCAMNFGLTLIRETFNFWTPTFLDEAVGLTKSQSAVGSALFPLVGAVSVFSAGALSDSFGGKHRTVAVPCMLLLIGALALLCFVPVTGRPILALALISLVSFFLLAPYSYLSGVMAIDLGGKQGSSTAAGLVDSAGYLGGVISGLGIGVIAEHYGWRGAFGFLAVVAAVTAAVAVVCWKSGDYTAQSGDALLETD